MSGFANTSVTGVVANEPEIKYLPSGTAVCTFSIPVSKRWTDKSGTEKENTVWYRVQTFGKQAETANSYVHKGMIIAITGELDPRPYLNKAGEAAVSVDLKANQMQFIRNAEDRQRSNDGGVVDPFNDDGGDLPF